MASKPSSSSIPPQTPLEESSSISKPSSSSIPPKLSTANKREDITSSCIGPITKSPPPLQNRCTTISTSYSSDLTSPLLDKKTTSTQRSNPSSPQEIFDRLIKSRNKESFPSISKPVPFKSNNDPITPLLISTPLSTYQSLLSGGGVNELLHNLDQLSNLGMEKGITSPNQPYFSKKEPAAADVEVDTLNKKSEDGSDSQRIDEIYKVLSRLDGSVEMLKREVGNQKKTDAFTILLLAITIFVGFSTAVYHLSDKCAMLNYELAISVANVLGVASVSIMVLSLLGEGAGVTTGNGGEGKDSTTAEANLDRRDRVGNEEAAEARNEVPLLESRKNAKWFHILNNNFFVPILMICTTAIMYIVFVYFIFRGACKKN
ncbi:hypothetical protein FRX31_013812 [Thalictrum thalictroides]|uniref:Transmembrane protein n=1 Tax=Thalictrum thalictroides TaxID=46969 RepID=A0A7J6WJ00_THATH|nr:hypothetical protein FRX31_013812 [Thalictrum thalictroides]